MVDLTLIDYIVPVQVETLDQVVTGSNYSSNYSIPQPM